jgi:hypothetical protein
MADFSLPAGTSRPAQGVSIVGHIEQNRIGMVSYQFCHDEMEGHALVFDNSNKLEDINQDEESILVVLFMREGVLLDRFRERYMNHHQRM